MLAVAVLFIAGWLLNAVWLELLAVGLIGLTLAKQGLVPFLPQNG